MTDFKAPPVPPQPDELSGQPAPETTVQPAGGSSEATDSQQPVKTQNTTVENAFQNNIQKIQAKTNELQQQFKALPESKRNLLIYISIFLIGLLLGWIFFGGSGKQEAPVVKGLQGVVANPDIKEKLKRCGMVSPSNPCVLYVMNSFDYEKLAKDFFDTAVVLTQRPDFLIRADNVRYSTMRIPPGYFAEIKIPMKR